MKTRPYLVSYRKAAGLTQEQLSKLVDISRDSLAKIETGAHGISGILLLKLAHVLHAPADELLIVDSTPKAEVTHVSA